jgi:hypothetical protein
MDAAEPDFEHHPIQIRLDPSDAQFVDAIHTKHPLSFFSSEQIDINKQ